jgi:hypothetical protein
MCGFSRAIADSVNGNEKPIDEDSPYPLAVKIF